MQNRAQEFAKKIEKIDTIVSETNDSTFDTTWVDVRNVPGAATGITVDDAGNILVGTNFPNAGSSTDFIIISADLKNSYKLQITLPEGVAANRIDQYGKVVGDLLSETGGRPQQSAAPDHLLAHGQLKRSQMV